MPMLAASHHDTYAFVPRFFSRSRWGMTEYLGSRADWKPALKTDHRSNTTPAKEEED
jgi:hypothetical protein